MLFVEIIAVYCENHTEHVNIVFGGNTLLCNVTERGRYR